MDIHDGDIGVGHIAKLHRFGPEIGILDDFADQGDIGTDSLREAFLRAADRHLSRCLGYRSDLTAAGAPAHRFTESVNHNNRVPRQQRFKQSIDILNQLLFADA